MKDMNKTAVQMIKKKVQFMAKAWEDANGTRSVLSSLEEKLHTEQMNRLLNISRTG